MTSKPIGRRSFLKAAGAGAAAVAGLRAASRASASEAVGDSPHKWAMVIDQARCTGCGYCSQACRAHNDIAPGTDWNIVVRSGELSGEPVYLPRPCMHCENAPCVEVCPVKASTRRADGIVMMDYDRCIGCRYCQVACPYGARAFNWENFTGANPAVPRWGEPEVDTPASGGGGEMLVLLCTGSIAGLSLGLTPGEDPIATPACVVACPVGARIFGDLADPESNVSRALASNPSYRLREDLGTSPRVYYLPARERASS